MFLFAATARASHTVTTVVVPNLCAGQCTATATAVVTGGSGNFAYSWSTIPSQDTATATNLCAGTYLVVVTDLVNGDQVPAFAIVTDPPPLVIFFNTVAATCAGNSDGSIAATTAGGTSPYTYAWSNGETTPSISGLSAGTYTLTVTDGNGCSVSQSTAVTQPAPIVPNLAVVDARCAGLCDGAAVVSPAGGTPPYSFLWSNGSPVPAISNACAGSYSVVITDANGCSITVPVTIGEPPPLDVAANVTDASCNGACDGSISVTPSGGTAPYTFLWTSGQTTASITGLCTGTYTVTVTDAHACATSQSVTVGEPPPLVVTPTSADVTCNGLANGSASANASGGTPPYTYLWSPGGETTASIINLGPGLYGVTVTDANGCASNASVGVSEPSPLIPNLIFSDATGCSTTCNGSASVAPSGGTPPYTIVWSPGVQSTPSVTNLCAGAYSVLITDAAGCSITVPVAIAGPPPLAVAPTSGDLSCHGGATGNAIANASGGTPPYTYLWSNGETTASINNLAAGSYAVTVTDANGCTAGGSVQVTEPAPLSVTQSQTNPTCASDCNGSATVSVSGGVAPYSYAWSNGQTSATAVTLCAGSYSVIVTDANGCGFGTNFTLVAPAPVSVTATSTPSGCSPTGTATASASGGTGPYTYVWTPAGGNAATATDLAPGTYSVTATDTNGCAATASVVVAGSTLAATVMVLNQVSCNGAADGVATVTPSGGTAPYTFAWSPAGGSTATASALPAGTYIVTVSDAAGCTATVTATITQPAPLSAAGSASMTSSATACDGQAAVTPAGGTAPYTVAWSNGASSTTITGLCAATYTATVHDASGCSATYIATVTAPSAAVPTLDPFALLLLGALLAIAGVSLTRT